MTLWTMPRRTDDDVVSGGGMRLTEVDMRLTRYFELVFFVFLAFYIVFLHFFIILSYSSLRFPRFTRG